MASELPPTYNSLHTSNANITIEDEAKSVPNSDDDELIVSSSFEDKTTRIGFIQKVLAIKVLQLMLVTIGVVIFAAMEYEIHWRMNYYSVHIMFLTCFALFAVTGLMFYCTKARYENPFRYVFLLAQPIALTLFVCFPAAYCYVMGPLALAFGAYALAVFAVMLYSVFTLQTKLNFAAKYAIFIAGFVQILAFAFTAPFLYLNVIGALYVSLALCLNYVYMFRDLEFMVSTRYWHRITPDDYVDGALNLQLDYYYMFVNVIMPALRTRTEVMVKDIDTHVGDQNN